MTNEKRGGLDWGHVERPALTCSRGIVRLFLEVFYGFENQGTRITDNPCMDTFFPAVRTNFRVIKALAKLYIAAHGFIYDFGTTALPLVWRAQKKRCCQE